MNTETKKCPACAEEIQAAAIKCKHCGSILTESKAATAPAEGQTANLWNMACQAKLGPVFLGLGAVLIAFFFLLYDTTVFENGNTKPDENQRYIMESGYSVTKYYSQGRLQTRNIGAATGLVFCIIGTILLVSGKKERITYSAKGASEPTINEAGSSGKPVSNSIIWVLACAPLIGAILESFVSGLTGISQGSLWFVTIALNIGLCYADEKKLKAAGHDTAKMGGAWLVPVYIFKRAKILKHNYAYFIVWCVLFGLLLIAG